MGLYHLISFGNRTLVMMLLLDFLITAYLVGVFGVIVGLLFVCLLWSLIALAKLLDSLDGSGIPRALEYSVDDHKITLKNNDKIRWIQKHEARIAIWNTLLDHIFQGELIVGDNTVSEYQSWYLDRSVRFISRLGAFHHRIGVVFRLIVHRMSFLMCLRSLLMVVI